LFHQNDAAAIIGATRELLQADRLHPTPKGCASLVLATLAALTDDGELQEQLLWDPKKILQLTKVD